MRQKGDEKKSGRLGLLGGSVRRAGARERGTLSGGTTAAAAAVQ